jgi:hypothetical protein
MFFPEEKNSTGFPTPGNPKHQNLLGLTKTFFPLEGSFVFCNIWGVKTLFTY